MLSTLTSSPLVTGSLDLLLNWSSHAYLPLRIFKRLSSFLRQVSQDNDTVGALCSEALDTLVVTVATGVNKENADFVADLLGFHFQVSLRRWGQARVLKEEYLQLVKGCA